MSDYRIRAYVNGIGEVCCASTATLFSGKADIRKLANKYPSGMNAVIEKRDARARTGWRNVDYFRN